MGSSSMYSSLFIKVQSLEDKLSKLTRGARDSDNSSAICFTNKSYHYESIQNLLELAKDIKRELHISLKYSPENRKTLKMYHKVCMLESELYNLINCIQPFQNTNRKQRFCGSKDSCTVLYEIPMKDSYDYSEVFPKYYYRQRTSFAPQEVKTKISSDRCYENITKPEYIVERKNSSESFGGTSSYFLSSGSSSSTTTSDQNREPLYTRKSKSSDQARPSAVRIRRRTPERIPIYVKKSRGSSGRKREKRKRIKPILKKSSLRFGIHKSDSNKISVRDSDLPTQETQVFLVKKERKPSGSGKQSEKSASSGRYLISRLKKVLSSKSRPLVSKRNKTPKSRKYLTPEYRENKDYVTKNTKKRFGISKYKENNTDLEDSSPKYSEDSLYREEKRRKKPNKNRVESNKLVKSRESLDSKPVTVARSSNLTFNPFYNKNNVYYKKDSSFVLFPKKVLSKDFSFSRNRGQREPYSKVNKVTPNGSFIKPVKVSNLYKKRSISNTDSNYEIVGSNRNSNLYLKETPIQVCTLEVRPNSRIYEGLRENVSDGRINKYVSLDNNKKHGDYNSDMPSKRNYKDQSKEKFIFLKAVNGPISMFEDKESSILRIKSLNNKDKNRSFSQRLVLKKESSCHNNPFGVSATTPIYLATVPQKLPQKLVQNPPSLSDTTQNELKSHDYIVNSVIGNYNNKGSLNSSPSDKSTNAKNILMRTANKSSTKILPFKNVSKDTTKSNAEPKGIAAPLQNTKSLSRLLSLGKVQPTSRNESHADVLRSVGSFQSSTSKKTKQWLPRSLSKTSIVSKKGKKTKGVKDSTVLTKEASKNNLTGISKLGSEEKPTSSEKVPKAKSWTSFKRKMSGVGSVMKLGKSKKRDKKSDSENKLKKQSTLKTQMSDVNKVAEISSTGPINTSEYEGDKTSLVSPTSVISNHSPNTIKSEPLESKKLDGYQVGSKLGRKGNSIKKDLPQSILAPSRAQKKNRTIKDDPKAFNYSLHYTKEKHKCVETDLVPSKLYLVDSCCPPTVVKTCGSKNLWSKYETVLSEHELSEFKKHNKYHEFFFKPNNCRGCTVYEKKVSKVGQERDERISKNKQQLSSVCSNDNNHLYNDPISSFKSIPVTTSDYLTDSSDICDWKKIANEIKECH